jgi:hypothetical protein
LSRPPLVTTDTWIGVVLVLPIAVVLLSGFPFGSHP